MGRKDGKRKTGKEVGLINQSQKEVHTAHPSWKLDRRLFIFLDIEPDRLNLKSN